MLNFKGQFQICGQAGRETVVECVGTSLHQKW